MEVLLLIAAIFGAFIAGAVIISFAGLIQFIMDPMPYLAWSLPTFAAGLLAYRFLYGNWPAARWWRLWAVAASVAVLIGTPVRASSLFIILGCFANVELILRVGDWMLNGLSLKRAKKQQLPHHTAEPSSSEVAEKPAFGRRSSPPPVSYRNSR